jgi:hypothetical protein
MESVDEPEPKKVSISVVLNTGGKTLEELVNFPMCSDASPPAPEQQEQIGSRLAALLGSLRRPLSNPA